MDKLRAIEYFVQTVEAGSMAAAARHLEVSPPAITKQIAALERELGVTLLRRDSRKLFLTDDGDRYLKACTRLLDELRETESQMVTGRSKAHGRLVVGISRTVAQHCIVPNLAAFRVRCPELELEFRNVNYMQEPLARLCDVLVLIGWQDDIDWIAQPLGRGRHCVVATPAFWKQHGMPDDPKDIQNLPCLGFRVPRGVVLDRWKFTWGAKERTIEPRINMVFDDRDTLIQAVLGGHGMHFGNDMTMLPWLRNGTLQVALPQWVGNDAAPVNLLYRRGARASASVRAFGDFVASTFSALTTERNAYGPADTGAPPDWFKAHFVGSLAARK